MTAVILATLAVTLAGPVPILLARATWPYRVPRAALVLWQALSLAAVLAALGAGLATALQFVVSGPPSPVGLTLQLLVLGLTAVVAARLAWSTLKVMIATRSRRRRHRELVDLLGDADGLAPGLRVLAEQRPVAYCLPAVRDARVVVSAGALDRLADDEMAAVLAHEWAHLRARHDLVLEAFTALRQAFPAFVRSREALTSGQLLVELLADDAARRRVGPGALARALVALAHAPVPDGSLAAGNATALRIQRLAEPERDRPLLAGVTYLAAAAVLVIPTVTVALPWLGSVLAALL